MFSILLNLTNLTINNNTINNNTINNSSNNQDKKTMEIASGLLGIYIIIWIFVLICYICSCYYVSNNKNYQDNEYKQPLLEENKN